MTFTEKLDDIASRPQLPGREAYQRLLERTITVLEHEDRAIRPADSTGLSGGLVYLKKNIPTVILPDLHGRTGFFARVMNARVTGQSTVIELLQSDAVQVLCLGDGFHSERRGLRRWLTAFDEYILSYARHDSMDGEMRESLALMEMVMESKCAFPGNFHFLKGNHENILNEEGNGNHAFRKFTHEGEMVREYIKKFYGDEFLDTYAIFEKRLPLFAIGALFLASHAEPCSFYTEEELVEARNLPEIILGLTWTNNGDAAEGSVRMMLEHHLGTAEGVAYFGGHRPVPERFLLRADKKYVQIHNPDKGNIVVMMPDRPFDPELDIRDILEDGTNEPA